MITRIYSSGMHKAFDLPSFAIKCNWLHKILENWYMVWTFKLPSFSYSIVAFGQSCKFQQIKFSTATCYPVPGSLLHHH
jgi:hypothetical protein